MYELLAFVHLFFYEFAEKQYISWHVWAKTGQYFNGDKLRS